jgi:hypothetical protein
MPTSLLTTSLLFLTTASPAGQLVTSLSPEVHSFNPPMVLEYGLDEVFKNSKPAGVFFEGNRSELRFSPTIETAFRNYNCRGVTLERVTFQLIRFEKETFRRLKIVSDIFNNSGKDKRVTITFEIVRGGDVIGSGTLKGLRVQQGDYAKASRGQQEGAQEVAIILTQRAEEQPYPKLRVTMDLTDY